MFALTLLLSTRAAAVEPPPQTPEPRTFDLAVPVNIVFIGLDRAMISRAEVLAGLPRTYQPVVRINGIAGYGSPGRNLGLRYDFRYRLIQADRRFEDEFFAYLLSIGQPADMTDFQRLYNEQSRHTQTITGPILNIDAPAAEDWLASHARRLGINTATSYTAFYINWFGRSDFRFHGYQKTDEPDIDTGHNFGAGGDEQLEAWGGTSSRTWFYDFSAGPTLWSYNFDVDNADVDGDGVADYRMPVFWEYAQDGYRDPAHFSSDIAKLTRYVAIDCLFTSSPIYDPAHTRPEAGGSRVVHLSLFQDDPSSTGQARPDVMLRRLRELVPYNRWQADVRDYQPIDLGARRAYRIFAGIDASDDCWTQYGDPSAELFCYFDALRHTYIPPYGPKDYVAGAFAFNTTDANAGQYPFLLGLADDNWVDGTPSFTFTFHFPRFGQMGVTGLTTHELGHHFGLSHPHDGFDWETGRDFYYSGEFYFAWAGDESQTPMNYMYNVGRFGRFNQDNIDRWEMATTLQRLARVHATVGAHPNGRSQQPLLERLRRARVQALNAFRAWRFREAAQIAQLAYDAGVADTAAAGIPFSEPRSTSAGRSPNRAKRLDPRLVDAPRARPLSPKPR